MQTTKTMGLRIRAQSASATKIAMMLEEHPMVDIVEHPMVELCGIQVCLRSHRRNLLTSITEMVSMEA